jgi:hypothetical protein
LVNKVIMRKKVISAIVLGLIMTIGLQAQKVNSPKEVTINIEPLRSIQVIDPLSDPMSLLSPSDTLKLSASILLADTNSLSKIHVKLGTTLGGNELLENTYTYDLSPTGSLTYFRDKQLMTLGMGTHLNSGIFYCEIKLEDREGNFSSLIKSQTQQ